MWSHGTLYIQEMFDFLLFFFDHKRDMHFCVYATIGLFTSPVRNLISFEVYLIKIDELCWYSLSMLIQNLLRFKAHCLQCFIQLWLYCRRTRPGSEMIPFWVHQGESDPIWVTMRVFRVQLTWDQSVVYFLQGVPLSLKHKYQLDWPELCPIGPDF